METQTTPEKYYWNTGKFQKHSNFQYRFRIYISISYTDKVLQLKIYEKNAIHFMTNPKQCIINRFNIEVEHTAPHNSTP